MITTKLNPRQFVLLPDLESVKRSQSFRKIRIGLSETLHEISSDKRLRWCGYGATNNEYINIRLGLNKQGNKCAGASGLIMCNRVWTCPVCSYKISNKRNDDLKNTFRVWKQEHGSLLFITFTLSHKRTDTLKSVWDALNKAWGFMLNGKAWDNFSTQYGVEGFVRATELTHGANGWHTHFHTALFVNQGFDDDKSVAEIKDYISNRWTNGLAKSGFTASASVGVDVRRTYSDSGLSKYLNKFADEITKGNTKIAKSNNRTPFAILQDVKDSKDLGSKKSQTDLALWWEFEKISKGRRQLVISKKVRALVKLTPIDETIDEYIIDPITVMTISPGSWRHLKQNRLLSEFYNRLENNTFVSVITWLNQNDVGYMLTAQSNLQENMEFLNGTR